MNVELKLNITESTVEGVNCPWGGVNALMLCNTEEAAAWRGTALHRTRGCGGSGGRGGGGGGGV